MSRLCFRFTNDTFGKVRLQTNASKNADFLNYIRQQTRKKHLCRIIRHLNPFMNSNNCNFTFKISDKTMLCGWSFLPEWLPNACPTEDKGTGLHWLWPLKEKSKITYPGLRFNASCGFPLENKRLNGSRI